MEMFLALTVLVILVICLAIDGSINKSKHEESMDFLENEIRKLEKQIEILETEKLRGE